MYGIEIEVTNVSSRMRNLVNDYCGTIVHLSDDGSMRTSTIDIIGRERTVPLVGVQNEEGDYVFFRNPNAPNSFYGCEIKTEPLSEKDALRFAQKFADITSHIESSGNSAIHIHIDVGNKPWKVIQNGIKWIYYLESVWYRLSSGGIPQRGVRNSYKYYRPLSNPISYYSNGKYHKLVNTEEVINAPNATRMLAAWGRLDTLCNADEKPRYIPHRLHGINLYSVVLRGTLELRLFNGVYGLLPAFVRMAIQFNHLMNNEDADTCTLRLPLGSRQKVRFSDVVKWIGESQEKLWHATKWQPAPETDYLDHHYNSLGVNMNSKLRTIASINRHPAIYDNGEDTFVIFYRHA